jgi:hypothetical protein
MGKLRARRLLPFRFRRMTPINLLHDPLCPADSICNGSDGCRNPRSAVILCQLPCRENAGGNEQHALPALIHLRSLALSLCIRHKLQIQSFVDP